MKNILLISGQTNLAASVANKTIIETVQKLLPEVEVVKLDELYPDFKINVPGSCYKLTLYPKWCKDSPSRKQGEWPRFHNILDILTSALFLAQRQAAQT